ncbi:hypothetical protein CBS101457_000853 [Exobasidium rhododendri]|nr:hypothetical protein CBS101457_000853 [Exobasidium rhododendri]
MSQSRASASEQKVESESDDSDSSGSDSEELEWPADLRNEGRPSKEERLRLRQASVEAQDVAQRIRLSGESDTMNALRDMRPRRMKGRPFQRPSTVLSPEAKAMAARDRKDLEQIHNLLSNLKIKKEEDEAKQRKAFEAKNKALWETVEEGIRLEEEKRARAAREEQERVRMAKEQREAAERRAKEMKEAKEARAREESEANEKSKKDREEREREEAKAEAERAREAEREEKAKSAGGVGVSLDREARDEFEKWWSKMNHIKTNVLPVIAKNPEWRKQCFTAKRTITRGVSQLTNSRVEVVRITNSIDEVLVQAKGAAASGEIYTWILNHLSKCLIRQAEQEVASKQDTAFPLARVVVWLLLQGHSEFGDVLMARLTKKCCWCLPHCPGKKPSQDDAAYVKILGKTSKEETTFAYTTRMTGIIAFYFAICQTTPSAPPRSNSFDAKQIPEQFRVKALWIWQARAMSTRVLDQSLSPALWSALIEIAGRCLLSTYGKQTVKVWKMMLSEGLLQEKAGFCKLQGANSAKVRLMQLLEDWNSSGTIQGATPGREMEA